MLDNDINNTMVCKKNVQIFLQEWVLTETKLNVMIWNVVKRVIWHVILVMEVNQIAHVLHCTNLSLSKQLSYIDMFYHLW